MSDYNCAYQYCPNPECRYYQVLGLGNVGYHDRKNKRFRCNNCSKTWVGHRGEFHYGMKTQNQKVKRALQMIQAGISIRKVASYTGVSPSTVMRWKKSLNNTL